MAHVSLGKQHPDVYKAQVALDAAASRAAESAGLDPLLVELVRIRVSQLNGCAFCLRMHVRDALAAGESSDRLAVVAAWWESQYFSEAEQAALALAEQVTAPASAPRFPVPEGALSDEQHSAVAWVAIAINGWNRIAVTSHYPVGPDRS